MATPPTTPSQPGGGVADPAALMRIRDLELRARAVVEGAWKGLHRSSRHGFSTEFAEYRSYVPGDDIRYLDWKVLARRDRTFIRKFREETTLQCHILLDLSRSMGFGSLGYSKLEYARTLAATLAVFLHLQGDEIGLLTFDSAARDYLPPRRRSGHLHAVLAALAKPADGAAAALHAPVEAILARGRSRGVMFVMSDFLNPPQSFAAPLSSLAACGHDITIFQILDPAESGFTFDAAARFEDVETGRVLPADPASVRDGYLRRFGEHQQRLRSLCDSLGILHHVAGTDQALERALHRYLSDRRAAGNPASRARRH